MQNVPFHAEDKLQITFLKSTLDKNDGYIYGEILIESATITSIRLRIVDTRVAQLFPISARDDRKYTG